MNKAFRILTAIILSSSLLLGDYRECVSLYQEVKQLEQQIDEHEADLLFVNLRQMQQEYDEQYVNDLLTSQQAEIDRNEQTIAALENTINKLASRSSRIAEYISTYDERTEDNLSFLALRYTYDQRDKYPTGCESVALHILLRYYDVDAPMKTIVERLPKAKKPWYGEDGVRYGYDPEEYFIGNPTSTSGYGVFNGPIAQVAETFKPGVISRTGMDFSEVIELIDQGKAVMVWSSVNLKIPYVSQTWQTPEGKTIEWLRHEHAVVVVGYDSEHIIISDPHNGTIRNMDRARFIKVYNIMGQRAVYY